jgi:hypothetical protein
MTCGACGSPAVELVHQEGGTDAGRFTERYRCETCGARGRIAGDAAAPAREWRRTGRVFGR